MIHKTKLSFLAAVLLLACATRADAQSTTATEHAKRAQVAYDLQNWPTAIQEYQAAYAAEAKADYLWGLAQAQRASGDCATAIKTFKAYKRNDITSNQSTAAELQITRCEAETEKKQAEAALAAQKAAEATKAQAAPSNAPAPGTSPPPKPETSADADHPATPAGPKPFYADVLGDVLFIGGVGAASVGTYFLLKGNSNMSSSPSNPTYRLYDLAVDHAAGEQKIGTVTLAIGGALLAGAVVRWLTRSKGAPAEAQTGFVVTPAGVAGRF